VILAAATRVFALDARCD